MESVEIGGTLKRLAAEYYRAATQKERDKVWRGIVRTSYKQERDREGAHRRSTNKGKFNAAMLHLDDPSMLGTKNDDSPAWESDGGKGAESIRSGGAELLDDVKEEALSNLSKRDRDFALDVLDGRTWMELEMPKRTFNWKIKKVCSLIAHPLQKSSLER